MRVWTMLSTCALLMACEPVPEPEEGFEATGEPVETTGQALMNDDPDDPVDDSDDVPPPDVSAPTNLRVTLNEPGHVKVSYDCGTGYQHVEYRSTNGGPWEELVRGGCDRVIDDEEALPARRYCYKVVATSLDDTASSSTVCTTVRRFRKKDEGSTLDRPRPRWSGAQVDMISGRLSKLPVSPFWSNHDEPLARGTLSGDHDIAFRTVCDMDRTRAGECDTGLVVTWKSCSWSGTCATPHTLFNDDDGDPHAHGTGSGTGSFVDPPRQPYGVDGYRVYAFSMNRGSSWSRVEYSVDGGQTWTALTHERWIGGTLVSVGPMADGEWLEVQTRTDGQGHDGTELLLFRPDQTGTSTPAALYSDGQGTDLDPRVAVSGSGFLHRLTYALVGKKNRVYTTRDPEIFVDLVRGPAGGERYVSMKDCDGGPCSTRLQPGRYLVSVLATVDRPVGEYDPNDASTWHLAGDQPLLYTPYEVWNHIFNRYETRWEVSGYDGCPNAYRDGLSDSWWFRGQHNDMALSLRVQRAVYLGDTFWYWSTVKHRTIPRGAFGSAPGRGYDRFALELEVDYEAEYRVLATPLADDVRLSWYWRYERNPQATELKVVSANVLFGDGDHNPAKYRNTADLLGTRGDRGDLGVAMTPDRAPYEWEADVIGLQEVSKASDGNDYDLHYSLMVLDELQARTDRAWGMIGARGETWLTGWRDGPGMNPLYVRRDFFPADSPRSVHFPTAAMDHADCATDGEYRGECHLNEQGWGDGDTGNFFAAGRAKAWRGDPFEDRPIAVFNLHMEASDGPKDFAPRRGELQGLMQKIDRLLEADHRSFNRASESDRYKSSPLHHQNRMIVMGDLNVRSHECGEHYWILRDLRRHYGYAVAVSMAVPDRYGDLSFGTHVGEAGYGPDEMPLDYQHPWAWDRRDGVDWVPWQADPDFSRASRYPWWAVDFRGKTSQPTGVGEKLSMIILVGRGWAQDDPVLDYDIMNDVSRASPMHADARAVEMWRPDACDDPGAVTPETGYRPRHSLGCDDSPHGGTRPGAPALHSDHRPMGARLRIWKR